MVHENVYASAKPTEDIMGAFERVRELEPTGLDNAAIFERAENWFVSNYKTIDFNALNKKKAIFKYSGKLPNSFKVRINSELDSRTNAILADTYNLTRVLTPWKLRLVMTAYVLFYLEKQLVEVEEPNINSIKVKLFSTIVDENNVEKLKAVLAFFEGGK